jgi:hypothetical protein
MWKILSLSFPYKNRMALYNLKIVNLTVILCRSEAWSVTLKKTYIEGVGEKCGKENVWT